MALLAGTTFRGQYEERIRMLVEQVTASPDVILFINGLPLVVIELKNAADENATTKKAFDQLHTYKLQLPTLMTYNAALIASDGVSARIGTLTSKICTPPL